MCVATTIVSDACVTTYNIEAKINRFPDDTIKFNFLNENGFYISSSFTEIYCQGFN